MSNASNFYLNLKCLSTPTLCWRSCTLRLGSSQHLHPNSVWTQFWGRKSITLVQPTLYWFEIIRWFAYGHMLRVEHQVFWCCVEIFLMKPRVSNLTMGWMARIDYKMARFGLLFFVFFVKQRLVTYTWLLPADGESTFTPVCGMIDENIVLCSFGKMPLAHD